MDLDRHKMLLSPRLRLAPVTELDPDQMVGAINDFDIARWLTHVPHPYTRADAQGYLQRLTQKPAPVWAIHAPSGFVGCVSLNAHLGYWLVPQAWGHGYMTEAARRVLHAYFEDPGAPDVESSYFNGNTASAAVLRKLGFVETGDRMLSPLSLGRDVPATNVTLTRAAFENQPVFALRTDRLILDKLTPKDAPVVATDWGNPRIARMTATVKANWTLDEARAWILERGGARRGTGCAIRLRRNGALIGSIGMGRNPANIGYMLGQSYWGKGYATEAARAFLAAAYRQFDDLDEVGAGVFDDNPGSARVLQKLGFERLGGGDCTSLARVEPAANSDYRLTKARFEKAMT